MRKLKKVLPIALAMSLVFTMTPIHASAEETDTSGYKLVFSDEFDGTELNRDNWNVEQHEKGWVNNELQAYVDSDENIQVKDGNLYLIPVKKVETVADNNPGNLLQNADFSDGMTGWTETIANWGDGYVTEATSEIADGAITYTIHNPGEDVWHVQLKQTVKLDAGKTYVMSYKIKSDVDRQILSGVQGNETNNYASFGDKGPQLVAGEEQEVSFDVYSEDGFENAALYFSLGRAKDNTEIPDQSVITISDICLKEKDAQTTEPTVKEKVSYTSGRISTQNLQTFTYGKFEARVKVPTGQGYLPAFWLMANDENVYGQWPRCGEIDCMEVMGQEPEKVYGTIHYGNPHAESQGTYTLEGSSFADDFHVFTCEWEPGKISWFVDGVLYHEESNWHSTTVGQGTLTYPAPFDQPFYIILNLAVGGNWVGNPNEETSFENNPFIVDYVRVYQKDSYDENVTRPEVKFEPRDPDENGNYVVNGTFSEAEDLSDNTNWKFMTALEGEATAEIKDNSMIIKTENQGTVDYSVQLVQANIPFEKGATYEVSFDASASENRVMNVDVKAPDRGYQAYMKTFIPELTTEMKNYKQQFVMKADSDENGRLEFNMGAADSTADITIKNVVVKKVADPDPNATEDKTILANGSFIYNGGFQEGTNHLGYWDITPEGANVTVTGFADGRRLVTDGNKVTISQSDLAFSEGKPYALSFDAYSENGANVTVNVGGNEYDVLIEKGTTKQDYKVTIPDTATFKNKNVAITIDGAISLDNVKMVEAAMIKNGSFNDGLSGYEIYVDSSAKASIVVDSLKEDNALDATITNTGTEDWKIQVKQNNVLLEKGKTYKLTYSAKSSMDRKLRVIMQGGDALGYPVYSEHEDDADANDGIVTLSSEFQTFTETFTMTHDTDASAFLSICMGAVGKEQITDSHRIVIDNISLVEVTEAKPEKPEVEKPEVVTDVKAVPAGKNKVKLTWKKVDNADGYLIYAQKNGKYGYCGMTGNTSFTDTKALDTDYNFYFVFAYVKDADGKMIPSKAGKYVYAKGICTAVTNLKAASVKGGVKLSWTATAGADGYLIYGIVNGKKYGYVGMTSNTSFTDKKASATQYNFYWVIPYHKTSAGKIVAGQFPSKYTYGKAR